MRIRGHVTVSAGISTRYSYGRLVAHFKGTRLADDGDEVTGDPLVTLAISVDADSSGNVVIQSTDAGEKDD